MLKNPKKILFLLEFAIPQYRYFLYKELQRIYSNISIYYTNERFPIDTPISGTQIIPKIKLPFDIEIGLFNPFSIKKFEIIITTINLRRPHCWLPLFLFPNKKWILWGHGYGKNRSKIVQFLWKHILVRSSGFITYHQDGKDYLSSTFNYPESKILVSNNTMSVQNSGINNNDETKQYFLYVGRIQERKNLVSLLEAITKTKNNVKLVIVGDGIYKQKLLEKAKQLSISDRVDFKEGTFDEDALKLIFNGALAYVSPQNLGLGVVHSFAYGVPIITQKEVPHGPEFSYCDNSNTFFYNGTNELSTILNKIQSNPLLSRSKGDNAFMLYKNKLTPQHMVNTFVKALESN